MNETKGVPRRKPRLYA